MVKNGILYYSGTYIGTMNVPTDVGMSLKRMLSVIFCLQRFVFLSITHRGLSDEKTVGMVTVQFVLPDGGHQRHSQESPHADLQKETTSHAGSVNRPLK